MIGLLSADPTVCSTSVSMLSRTGESFPLLFTFVLGAAIAGLGILLLLRRARVTAAFVGALLLGALVLSPPATPANAAGIEYGPGCALVTVDGITLSPQSDAILPGDSVAVLSALVTNQYRGTISLDGTVELGTGALADAVTARAEFDGSSGPVTLASGDSVSVIVILTLPVSATDALQGTDAPLTLTLTAMVA